MPTPEHNPQNINIGFIPIGSRLCRESEQLDLPEDAKYWDDCYKDWRVSGYGSKLVSDETWRKYTYITTTSLPLNERVSFGMISRKEREPTEIDMPIIIEAIVKGTIVPGVYYKAPKTLVNYYWCGARNLFSYIQQQDKYKEIDPRPPTPSPPLSQHEKDEALFKQFIATDQPFFSVNTRTAFFGALNAERTHFDGRSAEEVKQIIKEFVPEHIINFNRIPKVCT